MRPSSEPVDPARRQAVRRSAARILGTVVALGTLYAVAPVPDASRPVAIALAILGGIAVVIVSVGRSVVRIRTAEYPALKAAEAAAVAVPLLLLLFAYAYLVISAAKPEAFSEPLSRVDAVYLSTTILATVGFGDITAQTDATRGLVTFQMLANLVLVAAIIRFLFGVAGEAARERRR